MKVTAVITDEVFLDVTVTVSLLPIDWSRVSSVNERLGEFKNLHSLNVTDEAASLSFL